MFRSSRKEPDRSDPAETLMREVGAQLRQVRIERGEELEDVARFLRIRPSYLYGLEQGDLSVIPGRTYALGFLRSYAQYLGFDGDDLVARIRSSVADLTGKTRLQVRSPLPESRLPKAPILVASIAALAGIYVGWAYVDRSSRPVVEVVAEMPGDLQKLVRDARSDARARGEPIQLEPAGEVDEVAAVATAPEATPEPEEEGASAEAAALEPTQPPAEPESAPLVEPLAEPEAGPEARSEPAEPAAASEPDVVAALGQANGDGGSDLPPAAEILARLEPVGSGAAPRVYGDTSASARVILRARSRSWVHVSSTDGEYVWIETLEPGDAYVVPDRADLMLWTGNAGGVEVIVDGAPLAPLGTDAEVVRDVPLRPQALLRRLPVPAAGPQPGR